MPHPIACTVTLLWVMIVAFITALGSEPCPKYCVCKKTQHVMDCDGRYGHLKSIPRPPSYVTKLQLTDTNLGRMTKEIMRNLTYCKLTSMKLSDNNITYINPDALSELKYLRDVEWKQSYLPIDELQSALLRVQSPLSMITIEADTLDTEKAYASYFQHLTSLQTLVLRLNEMTAFNTTGIMYMRKLVHLGLGGNQLADFLLEERAPMLETLNLDTNDLISVPTLCSGNMSLTPKLSLLSLENNAIRILNTSRLSCLGNLRKITLSQNRIEHLHGNAFANFPGLKELHLSRMTALQSMDNLAFNSTSLTSLFLKQNPKLSLKRFSPNFLFTHTPNLSRLDMSNTKLGIETTELKYFLLSLKNIAHLTLQRTSIKGLPVGVFSKLHKLSKLVLSGNYFSGWDSKVFANVTSIKHIFLDGNNIERVNESSFPLEFRLSVNEINLSNNPFACTCDLLWFRTWMKEVMGNKSIIFTNYPYRYDCRSPTAEVGPLYKYNPTLRSCTILQIYFVILVIILSACLAFTVVSLVTYRYRWYILYWISLMRRRRQRQGPPAEIQYDGFVSYSNPDWDWVSAALIDFLEGEVGLHLCEHSRDFKAGMYIVDNVIEAIDTSRKTILVISNEYMKSDWCQFELQMALSSFLKKEIDIIVILLEHIQSSHVTSSLRALMVSTTYIEWSEDTEARRLFQERLKNALRDV